MSDERMDLVVVGVEVALSMLSSFAEVLGALAAEADRPDLVAKVTAALQMSTEVLDMR